MPQIDFAAGRRNGDRKNRGKRRGPLHPANSAQTGTTHNGLLQALEVLLGLLMSLVQKSGGGGKQKILSGFSSRLHSFYISFYYLLYKLPMFTVQKLEKVGKRKDKTSFIKSS